MATAPVKSQPLHNFNFPFLKWGTHGGGSSSATTDHRRSAESDSDQERIRPTRVGSRSTRIHRLSIPPPPRPIKQSLREEEQQQEDENSSKPRKYEAEEEEEETVQRPWNLRPRKIMAETTAVMTGMVEKMSETVAPKSMRLRGLAENGRVVEKKEKRMFWIALSREEIEEDIFVMTGSRPARRPKKRSKNIQKQLDLILIVLQMLLLRNKSAFRCLTDYQIKGDGYGVSEYGNMGALKGMAHSDLNFLRLPYIGGGQSFKLCS